MAISTNLSFDDVFLKEPEEWLTTINTDKEIIYKRNNEILYTSVVEDTNDDEQCTNFPFNSSPQYMDINCLLQCKIYKKFFINPNSNTAFENVIFRGTVGVIDKFNNKYYLKVEDNGGTITVVVDHNFLKNSLDQNKSIVEKIPDEIFYKLNIKTDSTTIFQYHNPKIEDIEVDDNIIVNGKMKEWSESRYVFANSITAYKIN